MSDQAESRVRTYLHHVVSRSLAALRRVRRIERRELREFRRWAANTENLIHLSVLVLVPFLIALVTALSAAIGELTFLLFPPLASGTYTLFANPEGEYASPRKFVFGLTLGGVCGWLSIDATALLYQISPEQLGLHPATAALSIFLTGVATWALELEEPSAFSTALLVLVIDRTQQAPELYVLSIAVATALVASVFVLWRRQFYEQRAKFLYETIQADDHVLVPIRGETAEITALFAARLAAAHDAGKVVLLGLVEDTQDETSVDAESEVLVDRLEEQAQEIRTRIGVPCEVVVASGDPVPTTLDTARTTNSDLIVTPYEEHRGSLSAYVRAVLGGPIDAVAFRSTSQERHWKRVLVAVARPGDTAHAIIDFATRLAGATGNVSVCTCIDREVERRPAEDMLANLVETTEGNVETRVSRADIEDFLVDNADTYDLLIIGASQERSAASRFISPPTFERLHDVDCDVAVVSRGKLE